MARIDSLRKSSGRSPCSIHLKITLILNYLHSYQIWPSLCNTLVAFEELKGKFTGTTNCKLEDLVSCKCLLKTALFPTVSELLVIPPEEVETTNNYHTRVSAEKNK